jgi:protein-L-isoaspartate(D-aspartate) O-methyltransferase
LKRESRHLQGAVERVEEKIPEWINDPMSYGLAVWRGEIEPCREQIMNLLKEVYEHRFDRLRESDSDILSVMLGSRALMSAENYFRAIYQDPVEAWNIRERHMFETLLLLFDHFGHGSNAIVWAHTSHVGDARATELKDLREISLGELCRQRFSDKSYLVGFLTDHGTVAAAQDWGAPVEAVELARPPQDSWEAVFHETDVRSFFLPLRHQRRNLINCLSSLRPERNTGVIYKPDMTTTKGFVQTRLAAQFDEIVWIDETSAVSALQPLDEGQELEDFPSGI